MSSIRVKALYILQYKENLNLLDSIETITNGNNNIVKDHFVTVCELF